MQLKINKSTRNKIATVELSLVEITFEEEKMLEQYGEPVIAINKSYGANPVNFDKKLRKGFKVRTKFDYNLDSDMSKTNDYIESFIEDVRSQVTEAMIKLKDEYLDDQAPSESVIEIIY